MAPTWLRATRAKVTSITLSNSLTCSPTSVSTAGPIPPASTYSHSQSSSSSLNPPIRDNWSNWLYRGAILTFQFLTWSPVMVTTAPQATQMRTRICLRHQMTSSCLVSPPHPSSTNENFEISKPDPGQSNENDEMKSATYGTRKNKNRRYRSFSISFSISTPFCLTFFLIIPSYSFVICIVLNSVSSFSSRTDWRNPITYPGFLGGPWFSTLEK